MIKPFFAIADTLKATSERVIWTKIRLGDLDVVLTDRDLEAATWKGKLTYTLEVYVVSPGRPRWLDARELASWTRR